MTRRFVRWILLIIIIAAAGGFIWRATRPEPVAVRVKPAESGTVAQTVANTRAGTIKACRRAKLSPSIGGQIANLPVHEGDAVKAGQLLLELWNLDIVSEAALAQSEVASAKARAQSVCMKADNALKEADRLIKLHEKKVIAEEQTDRAVTEARSLKAECDAAKAAIVAGEDRVRVIQANLERTRLTAPFDGVIAAIHGELSEYVTPSPIGIPTPPVIDLIDNSCFYVVAPIDEVDAASISTGMAARIRMDAFGDRSFAGKVRRISDYVLDLEKQARTVDVEVEFVEPEASARLLAGYSADVEIILAERPDTLRVPAEAVLNNQRVFVFRTDTGLIEERIVECGLSNWDYIEIHTGLRAGEMVVVNADQAGVKHGAMAKIVAEAP
jgi:HlyD family secretion protein